MITSKLRKIANKLEKLGLFKEAVKVDKIAEALPELNNNVSQAYAMFGFSIGDRDNITEEQLRTAARRKISEEHPDTIESKLQAEIKSIDEMASGSSVSSMTPETIERAKEALKENMFAEANHNTRILIEAMKLAMADLKKYKATGTGLGQGKDGQTEQSDFYKWSQGIDTSEMEAIAKKLSEELKKTRTMYMHVKSKGEGFGEDDEKVQKIRKGIDDFKERVANKEVVWLEIKVPDSRGWRDRDLVLAAEIDLSTNTVLKLNGVAWRNSAKGRQLEELRDRIVGRRLDESAIRQAVEQHIKDNEYYIMRRKQQLLTEERAGGLEEKAVVLGEKAFYKEFLTSTPTMGKIENIVGIGIQIGTIRKLEKGPRKGLLTVEERGLDKLLSSDNNLFKFSGLVFSYLKGMVKQTFSSMNVYADDLAEDIIYSQFGIPKDVDKKDDEFVRRYYGEDMRWSAHTITENPEKYKVAIELKDKVSELKNVISLRAKEYAHAIAQVYKMGGVAAYYDPDRYTQARSGEFINDFYNSLSDYYRKSYEESRKRAEEFLSKGEAAIDVSDYMEDFNKRQEESGSKLEEYRKQKAKEEEEAIQKAKEGKLQEIEMKKEKFRQTKERLKDVKFESSTITKHDVEGYNKINRFYADLISALPEVNESMYPLVFNVQNIAEPKEDIPHYYGDVPLKKLWKNIKDGREMYMKHPENEKSKKYLPAYQAIWPWIDAWKRDMDKFMRGSYGSEMKPVYLSAPQQSRSEVRTEAPAGTSSEQAPSQGSGKVTFKQRISKYNKPFYEVSGDVDKIKDLLNKYGWDKNPKLIFNMNNFEMLKSQLNERGIGFEIVK